MSSTKNWGDFLNPEIMRRRFAAAGLFLVAHEILVSTIKGRLRDFYSTKWESDGGWKESASYVEKVRGRDPKKKNDALRGSISWLREYKAIDEADEAAIKAVTEMRNIFGHELAAVITGAKVPDFEPLFASLVGLVVKIERWWIINLDLEVDPDFNEQEIDEAEIVTGSQWLLEVMEMIALGKDEEAWRLYREFQKKMAESHGAAV